MKRHELDSDVLIIGGGPAGSVLACLLSMGDRRAILVEQARHPREHVGELLTPSVNAVLHRIGLLSRVDLAGFVQREGVGWTAPRAPARRILTIPVADHPPARALRRYGFNVERGAFDALLLQRARELGVQLLERTTVHRVLFEQNRAIGVEVRQPDGALRVVTGRFVVDASGRRCLLGTQLGLVEHNAVHRQCAMYAWFGGVQSIPSDGTGYAFVHLLRHQRAWGWQIPLRNGVTSVGIVVPCDQLRARTANRDVLFAGMIEQNRTFERVMTGTERISPWRVVGDYGYRLQRLSGCGWLLLGDAAGFIDPIFSSGVDIAMYSAVFAYEAILPLFLLGSWNDADEEFALSRYEIRVRRGMAVWAHGVELFYEFPRQLRRLANERSFIPAICRFLQGNPYEVQNELIVQGLFDRVTQKRHITEASL